MDIGTPLLPEVNTTDAGLAATASYDSREEESFSSHGVAAAVQFFDSSTDLGAGRNWQRVEAAVRSGFPAGKMMMWFTAAGGSELGSTLPADRAFSLGGPQSFPGYAMGEIRARRYWTADGSFLWHVADILPILSQKLYGGITLEGGQVYGRIDPVPDGQSLRRLIFLGRADAARNHHGRRRLGQRLAGRLDHARYPGWVGNDPQPSDVPLMVHVPLMVQGCVRCPAPRYGCASTARIRCEKSSALSAACARSLTCPRRCNSANGTLLSSLPCS